MLTRSNFIVFHISAVISVTLALFVFSYNLKALEKGSETSSVSNIDSSMSPPSSPPRSFIQGSLSPTQVAPPAPPAGFCQAKTDYDPNVTCSSDIFMVNTLAELQSYQSNFGLSSNQYKNLRIGFALSGTELLVHSPCKISFIEGLTHNINNLCLDGKRGVLITPNSIFISEKIHILSMEGNSVVQDSSVLMANELEVYSSKKAHINRGVRLDIGGNIRLISTYSGDRFKGIRFGPGSMVDTGSINIIGYGGLNFNSMSLISTGPINAESRGSNFFNKINIVERSNIRGQSVSFISGNNFELRNRSFLRSEQNAHIEAMGCVVQENTTVEAVTYSGSCLNSDRVNLIPIIRVGATPLSGEIPLRVDFTSAGSYDSDGNIQSYTWIFPDASTVSGSTAQYTFSEAGAYMVKLVVQDNGGAMTEGEVLITATETLASPLASFTFSPESGQAPLTVSFDGSSF